MVVKEKTQGRGSECTRPLVPFRPRRPWSEVHERGPTPTHVIRYCRPDSFQAALPGDVLYPKSFVLSLLLLLVVVVVAVVVVVVVVEVE